MYIWFKSEIKNSFFLDSHHFKAIRIILLSNIKAINKDILKPYDNSLTNLLLLGESRFNNTETYTIVSLTISTFKNSLTSATLQIQNFLFVPLYSVRLCHWLFYAKQSICFVVLLILILILLSKIYIFFHFILIFVSSMKAQYDAYFFHVIRAFTN